MRSVIIRPAVNTSPILLLGARCGTQERALGHDAVPEEAPQRHHQLARQGDDGDAPDAALLIADACVEPAAQRTAGLMASPQPSQLDGCRARSRVAGLADALLALAGATVERRAGQAEVAADLAPILEVAEEHLADQRLAADRPHALEVDQLVDLGGHRAGLGCLAGRCRLGLDLGDLLLDQQQSGVLPLELGHQMGRQAAAVAGAYLGKPGAEALGPRQCIAHALAMQQALDAVGVRRALLDQPIALAPGAPIVLLVDRRYMHHLAGQWVTPLVAHQGAHQSLEIQAVRLGPPRPPVDLHAGRIEHPALDPTLDQPAVQPEPVVSRFVAAHDPHGPTAALLLRPLPCLADQSPGRFDITAIHHVTAQLPATGDNDAHLPLRLAQFKGDKHRGMLQASGGGVDVKRGRHLFLRRLVVEIQTYLSTSRRPIESEETREARRLEGWATEKDSRMTLDINRPDLTV